MKTIHKIYFQPSNDLNNIEEESVALIVTSPPYPMIELWDEILSKQDPTIENHIQKGEGLSAFNRMHENLLQVWKEFQRILITGGIICINIGDATRSLNGNFQLFPSHARIIYDFQKLGFQSLPEIIWRKQTNAPNKFMGSGMLPTNAYVTYEHEYILIFRKGCKREFSSKSDKEIRRESAYFWEERNIWFSDIWDFKGASQVMNDNGELMRKRSAAYPFELAYRLVNMYSIKGDIVVDPFLGTGTTTLAAITSERNSIGIEIDEGFKKHIFEKIQDKTTVQDLNEFILNRIENHLSFINKRKIHKEVKYINDYHMIPVVTNQEIDLKVKTIKKISLISDNEFEVEYN
jgi:DNA modification methylase